jgi:hypothetical protein
MEWQLLGYKDYPFSIDPISAETINLFIGHHKEVSFCESVLQDKGVRIVIEGSRGVGTTSIANYLKYSVQKNKLYLSPRDEVSIEKHWNLESLLTAVISTIIREMGIAHENAVKNDKIYKEAKALSSRLSEAYNNFGLTAFSFGASYGKSSTVTQPTFVPATTLGFHLEDLGKLAKKVGYKNGILIQLNNLDINVVHSEEHLNYLFNAARDYFQIANISWFLVGDIGLRSFIAKKIDRLDDIISADVFIKPLSKIYYHELIKKRLSCYEIKKGTEFPLNQEIFDYLYEVAEGRLRYIFGLIYVLIQRLQIGKLLQKVSVALAKDAITALALERVSKFELLKGEEVLLKIIVKNNEVNVAELTKKSNRNRVFVSRTINKLLGDKLVSVQHDGNKRIYSPSLDVKIAFSESSG